MFGKNHPSIGPEEFLKKYQSETDLQVIDVREPYELTPGHALDKAKNIPLGQLQGRSHEITKEKPVYFLCQSGGRSAQATAFFVDQGYQAVNINGGMMTLSMLMN